MTTTYIQNGSLTETNETLPRAGASSGPTSTSSPSRTQEPDSGTPLDDSGLTKLIDALLAPDSTLDTLFAPHSNPAATSPSAALRSADRSKTREVDPSSQKYGRPNNQPIRITQTRLSTVIRHQLQYSD